MEKTGDRIQAEERIDAALTMLRERLRVLALSNRNFSLEKAWNELTVVLDGHSADSDATDAVRRHLAAVVEFSPDAIIGQKSDGNVFHWNPGAEHLLGFLPDEVLGKPFLGLVLQDRRETTANMFQAVVKTGNARRFETILLRKDGDQVDVSLTLCPIRGMPGNSAGLSIIARDISHRRLLEQETRQREEMESYVGTTSLLLTLLHQAVSRKDYLRAVVRIIQGWSGCHCVGIRVLSEDGAIPYESYVGFSPDFWESENRLIVNRDRCICTRAITGRALPCEETFLTPKGSFRCGNTFDFLAGLTREEKNKFRGKCIAVGFKTVAVVPIRYEGATIGAMHLADHDAGKVSERAVVMLESLSGLVGEAISKFNLQDKLEYNTEIRKLSEIEAQQRRDELAHLMRVAVAAEIASSLAHELNQPLSAILNNAQAARRFLDMPTPDIEEVRAALDDIVEDDQRAGNVIRKLRSMLKKSNREDSVLDINTIVRETVQLIAGDARKKHVTVEVDLAKDIPSVTGDPIQLQQVLLNLMLNGFDAMLDMNPAFRIMTVRTTCDMEANSIEVAVSDAGTGVKPDDLGRIFESFFTTKVEGIGMGLPISRYLIEAHGGRLWAVRNEGAGMTFRFSLPAGEKHGSE